MTQKHHSKKQNRRKIPLPITKQKYCCIYVFIKILFRYKQWHFASACPLLWYPETWYNITTIPQNSSPATRRVIKVTFWARKWQNAINHAKKRYSAPKWYSASNAPPCVVTNYSIGAIIISVICSIWNFLMAFKICKKKNYVITIGVIDWKREEKNPTSFKLKKRKYEIWYLGKTLVGN